MSAQLQSRQDQAADIAIAEFTRRKKRLGALTPEQETNVQQLIMSTAIKISDTLEKVRVGFLSIETGLQDFQDFMKS